MDVRPQIRFLELRLRNVQSPGGEISFLFGFWTIDNSLSDRTLLDYFLEATRNHDPSDSASGR